MADENEQQTACKAGRDEQHCKCKQRREAAAAAEAAAANGEHHCACKHEHAEGAAAEPGAKKECHCKHGEVAAAEAGEAKHCACKHDAHDAEGHAISTEPHLGFIEDLASLIFRRRPLSPVRCCARTACAPCCSASTRTRH